jgi:hypothetical protein
VESRLARTITLVEAGGFAGSAVAAVLVALVVWGAPPAVLLASLEHLQEPALRIRPPLAQRVLNAAVLAHLPRNIAACRTRLLRELAAASPAVPQSN